MPPGPERLRGEVVHHGEATGELLVLDAPLSLWGGSDPATGVITDTHHPQCGVSMAGRVVAMTSGRGSSSSSSVLAEQLRAGVAPAALLLAEVDAILALGALVAAELYDIHLPILHIALPPLPRPTFLQVAGADLEVVHRMPAGNPRTTSRSATERGEL